MAHEPMNAEEVVAKATETINSGRPFMLLHVNDAGKAGYVSRLTSAVELVTMYEILNSALAEGITDLMDSMHINMEVGATCHRLADQGILVVAKGDEKGALDGEDAELIKHTFEKIKTFMTAHHINKGKFDEARAQKMADAGADAVPDGTDGAGADDDQREVQDDTPADG